MRESSCYTDFAAYTSGAAVAKLAYAAGLKSAGDFPVVGSTPTSRTIFLSIPLARPQHPTVSCIILAYLFSIEFQLLNSLAHSNG